MNIYAPSEDNPNYFKHVSEKMSSSECDFIGFSGGFNFVYFSNLLGMSFRSIFSGMKLVTGRETALVSLTRNSPSSLVSAS